MSGNDFVRFMLRTPMRFLMGSTLLVTVTGRKTEKKYSVPVSYFREEGCLWVMTSRDRTWWRNVRDGARISIFLNGQTLDAFATAELDEKTVENRMIDYIHHFPMVAKSLGIRIENKVPNLDDIRRVGKDRLFVRIQTSPFGSLN
jgi:hypothetical protein